MDKKLAVCMAVITLATASAGALSLSAPRTHITPSEDGKYLLVLILDDEEWDVAGWNASVREEITNIRATYKESGLYAAGNSAECLWPMGWRMSMSGGRWIKMFKDEPTYYGSSFNDTVMNNGRHLVCVDPYVSDPRQPVMLFYESGKLIKLYRLKDLSSTSIKDLPNYGMTCWLDNSSVDNKALTFTIKTPPDIEVVFDVTSGKVISPVDLAASLAKSHPTTFPATQPAEQPETQAENQAESRLTESGDGEQSPSISVMYYAIAAALLATVAMVLLKARKKHQAP